MKECNCKDCKCDVIKSQKEKYLKMFPYLKDNDVHVELVGDIVKDNVRYKTYKTTIDYCNESGESIFIEDKKTIEIPVEKKSKIREEELNQYAMFVQNEKDKIKEEISEVYGKEIADSIEYGDIKVYNKEEEIGCNFECKKTINKGNIHVTVNYSKIVPYPKNLNKNSESLKESYEDFNKCIDEYLSRLPKEDENETDDSKEESKKVKIDSEAKKQTIENFVKEAKEKFLKELNEKFCVYSTRKITIEDIISEKCSNGCMCIIDKSCNELDFSCNLKYSKFYEFPKELKQCNVKDEKKEEYDTVKGFWNPKTGNNTKDTEENYKAWLKLQRINVCEYLSELYPKYHFSANDVDFRVILENKTKKAVRFEYDETFIGKRIYYSVIKDFDSEIDYVNKWDEYVANSEVKYRFEDKQYRDELSYNEIVDKLFRRHPIDTFEDFLDFCCRW